jgi:UDP-N-acetylmuramoyl-tripeptide--D-alanyl-D-alanine ligase
MAVTDAPGGWRIIDDSYNANPQSIAEAVNTLKNMADAEGRPAIAIIGEMFELGDKSEAEHGKIVQLLTRSGLDGVLLVGPVFAALQRAAASPETPHGIVCVPEASQVLEAVSELVSGLGRPDPIVLVKGSHGTGLWQLADKLVEGEPGE